MRKKIWVLLLSFFVFVAVAVIGVATIFVVDDVSLYFLDNSKVGLSYRDSVQSKIEEICIGKNILFLGEEDVMEAFDDTSYVKASSVKKVYPNKIVVYAEEVREVYAVKGEKGYCMLDRDGLLLSVSETNENRADGHSNILLENFPFDGTTFTDPTAFESVKTIYGTFDALLHGARTNILSICWVKPTSSAKDDFFEIRTQEGVVMQISDPFDRTQSKVEELVSMYHKLGTEEKMYGVILVYADRETNDIKTTYTSRYGEVRT